MAAVAESSAGHAAPAIVSDISDEALLEELQRRGLVPSTAAARVHSPVSRVASPPGSRVRSPDSRASGADHGPCLVEQGPRGGPLAPRLVASGGGQPQLFRVMETGGLRGSVEYSWEMVENDGEDGKGEHEQFAARGHHKRVARLHGTIPELLGRKCVQVCGRGNNEVFKLQDSASSWNPTHLRWSFRILPAGAEDDAETLFTVNRDVIGRGPLGLREQWRVFRGRARNHEEVYYGIGSTWGWDYHFYRSQADHDAGKEPVAHLLQAHKTGIRCLETGVWLPAEFDLSVTPGEDAGLLLAVATILDVAHERSQPPSSVV